MILPASARFDLGVGKEEARLGFVPSIPREDRTARGGVETAAALGWARAGDGMAPQHPTK